MLKILWSLQANDDYDYWLKVNPKIAKRIDDLIQSIQLDPEKGIGNPKPLKHNLSGFWSRRINREHRLVYKIENGAIRIVMCRFHY